MPAEICLAAGVYTDITFASDEDEISLCSLVQNSNIRSRKKHRKMLIEAAIKTITNVNVLMLWSQWHLSAQYFDFVKVLSVMSSFNEK